MKTRLLAALLIHMRGLKIDSLEAPGLSTADHDLLAGQLDAILRFLHSPATFSAGKWVSLITTDEMTLVIERGAHCYLAVALRGPIPEALPVSMRSLLAEFEALNGSTLQGWGGQFQDLRGPRAVLASIIPQDRGSRLRA